MKYSEKYHTERRWDKKVLIIHVYHHIMLLRKKDWRVRDTARILKISVGKASEDLKLAKELDKVIDCRSRNEALKRIK